MRILSCLGVPVAQRPEDARVRVRFPEAGLSDEASKRTICLNFFDKFRKVEKFITLFRAVGHWRSPDCLSVLREFDSRRFCERKIKPVERFDSASYINPNDW